MIAPMPQPRIQFFDDNGDPLAGGFVYTCVPGGTINDLKTSYQDAEKTTPNANPVELDSAGRATIFLDGYYHIFVQDVNEVDIYNVDNVSSSSFGSSLTSQWNPFPGTPTFVSGTQFQVDDNHAEDFPIGRRIRATVTAGIIYGTVSAVAAGGAPVVTTVTVNWDEGTLDAGLSEIAVGLLTPVYSSLPIIPVLLKNASFIMTMLDMNKFIVGSSGSGMNFTLPTTVPSGCWTRIHNAGAGTITLVGTVNGIASPTIATQGDAMIFFDGSSWYGFFYDAANATFLTSLGVGSAGGFPALFIDNEGDIDVSGGSDDIWVFSHQDTAVYQINADHSITLLQTLTLAGDPTEDLHAATKGYVDSLVEDVVALIGSSSWIQQVHLFPNNAKIPFWEDTINGAYQSVLWQTLGALTLTGTNNVYPTPPNNTGGYYALLYIPAAVEVYFHVCKIAFFGEWVYGGADATVSRGVRIGIGAPPIDDALHAYANYPYWPTVDSPAAFSSIWTSSDPTNPAIIDRVVLGPVSFDTPGWYSIFVQVYHRSEVHGEFFDPITSAVRIEGGVFATLSAA